MNRLQLRTSVLKASAILATATTLSAAPLTGQSAQSARHDHTDAMAGCHELAGKIIAGAVIAEATASGSACIVNGALHDTLKFRILLPGDWNGRLLYSGGGGWNGSISPLAFTPLPERSGYVIVASDSGHEANGIDASWAMDNPEAQNEFAYLSVHSVSEVSKVIVQDYYGIAPHHSYFEGCSNGGREGLVAASRFPSDFDGIISRAPANYWSSLFTSFLVHGQRQSRSAAAALGPQQAQIVERAALKQCDALDGIADGIIANPEACHLRLDELQCTTNDTEQCMTGAEIETAKSFYSGARTPDGEHAYPAWAPGGEGEGWPVWLTGAQPVAKGAQQLFGEGFYKYWILRDADADVMQVDPAQHVPALALADTMLTPSPDLRTFFDRGNKIILWHGVSDWAISYRASVQYFAEVAQAVGSDRRDASMKLFLAPGVQHCAGGAGADEVDLLTPLTRWVEAGERPETLTARKRDESGNILLARPLCHYPAIPRYRGGDTAAAANFTCEPPTSSGLE